MGEESEEGEHLQMETLEKHLTASGMSLAPSGCSRTERRSAMEEDHEERRGDELEGEKMLVPDRGDSLTCESGGRGGERDAWVRQRGRAGGRYAAAPVEMEVCSGVCAPTAEEKEARSVSETAVGGRPGRPERL